MTAKIVGHAAEANCVALHVLDLAYLLRSSSTMSLCTELDAYSNTEAFQPLGWAYRFVYSYQNDKIGPQNTPHAPPAIWNDRDDVQSQAAVIEQPDETSSPRHSFKHCYNKPGPCFSTDGD